VAIVVSNIVAAAMLEKLGCSQVVVAVVTRWELHFQDLALSSLPLPRLIENPYNS